MRFETEQRQKAEQRIKSEIIKMREYCRINQIEYKSISIKTGGVNVSKFFKMDAPEVSFVKFLLVAEAIGYELTISFKNN